jgi:N-acetyl-anhydromuramyl-L-alanine amidase AmpD
VSLELFMEKVEMLLNRSNTMPCGNSTIGALIAAAGKEALWSERSKQFIDVVVLHYMSAIEWYPFEPYKMEHIIEIFCENRISSHYVVDRDGVTYHLVPDSYKAWHAGGSIMPTPDNRQGVNDFSIGIELLATSTSGFTKVQYQALAELCYEIEKKHNRMMHYVGHEHIAGERAVALGLRSDCKIDPGDLFNWDGFFKALRLQRETNVP